MPATPEISKEDRLLGGRKSWRRVQRVSFTDSQKGNEGSIEDGWTLAKEDSAGIIAAGNPEKAMEMKAARLNKPRRIEERPLEIGEVERPSAVAGQVLLRVKACGVCRTDLHIAEGELKM